MAARLDPNLLPLASRFALLTERLEQGRAKILPARSTPVEHYEFPESSDHRKLSEISLINFHNVFFICKVCDNVHTWFNHVA